MARIKVLGTNGAVKPKKKAPKITSISIRETAKRDRSPKWDGAVDWPTDQFLKVYREAMQFYNLESTAKDLKPAVLKWMGTAGYDKETISKFRATKDWRCSVTMGSIATCLLKGMPEQRDDFNSGKNSADWLRKSIEKAIKDGKLDIDENAPKTAVKTSIQDRMQEIAFSMTNEIEEALELFSTSPDKFNPAEYNILNTLRSQECKAAHARLIKELYSRTLAECTELTSGKADDQLKEGYKHIARKNVKKLYEFHKNIDAACTMLLETAKVERKPRVKKVVPKDKLVEKLNYKKTDDALKLVSISPVDIIGSKELWVFNTKTRKLGKYIAAEFADLGVKGASIIGFDENKSIQKTLRKPVEQLAAFKASGKIALRKFLEEINSIDIKLNGRINEDVILLKAQ